MTDRVFRRTRVVEPGDVDFLGHVNNVVWLRWVVELAEAHASRGTHGATLAREDGGIWIVRRHELDYHLSALPGEEVVEETWVESMRGARSVRLARFTRPSDGAALVSARTEWAYVDADSMRPRRIPRALVEAFSPVS